MRETNQVQAAQDTGAAGTAAADGSFGIVQISDLHFQDSPGTRGFISHEPDEGLAAVLADAGQAIAGASLVVATGDLADTGEPGAYERMGAVLDTLPVPVYCLAGNHDRQDELQACLPRPNVHLESAVRVGNWLMLFLDSNAHGREADGDGTYRDRDDRVHAAAQPGLTPAEEARARGVLAATGAEHVFVWLHQPPLLRTAPDVDSYRGLAALVRDFPAIRAIGAGHLHGDLSGEFEGRPVYVCPSTYYSIDHTNGSLDGPGYRTYTLHPDGRVDTEVRTVPGGITEGMRRARLPRHLAELLAGRITGDEIEALSDAEFEERFGEPRAIRRS